MIREEFVNYIESLGFKLKYAYDYYYIRGSYGIILYDNNYEFCDNSKFWQYSYSDLSPFKKLDRRIKLKQLLG